MNVKIGTEFLFWEYCIYFEREKRFCAWWEIYEKQTIFKGSGYEKQGGRQAGKMVSDRKA